MLNHLKLQNHQHQMELEFLRETVITVVAPVVTPTTRWKPLSAQELLSHQMEHSSHHLMPKDFRPQKHVQQLQLQLLSKTLDWTEKEFDVEASPAEKAKDDPVPTGLWAIIRIVHF